MPKTSTVFLALLRGLNVGGRNVIAKDRPDLLVHLQTAPDPDDMDEAGRGFRLPAGHVRNHRTVVRLREPLLEDL